MKANITKGPSALQKSCSFRQMFCHHQRLTSADGLSPFLQILFEIRQSSKARQTKFAQVNTAKIDLI